MTGSYNNVHELFRYAMPGYLALLFYYLYGFEIIEVLRLSSENAVMIIFAGVFLGNLFSFVVMIIYVLGGFREKFYTAVMEKTNDKHNKTKGQPEHVIRATHDWILNTKQLSAERERINLINSKIHMFAGIFISQPFLASYAVYALYMKTGLVGITSPSPHMLLFVLQIFLILYAWRELDQHLALLTYFNKKVIRKNAEKDNTRRNA